MSEKECITCIKTCFPNEKGKLKSLISDHGTMLASVNPRPNSKFHTVIITKRHVEDLRGLTNQEWADILPTLKDSIQKIDKVYRPLGYRISIPIGEKGGQNSPEHFYCRVVPKYKKDFGSRTVPIRLKQGLPPGLDDERKKLQNILQPTQDKVIGEKSKIIARLHDGDNVPSFGMEALTKVIAISTKNHLPNDVNSIDPETWNEIGQMLKELMAKIEERSSIFNGFNVTLLLGEEMVKIFKEESEINVLDYPESQFLVHLFPEYETKRWYKTEKPILNDQYIGTMENERIAEKLNNPEAYAKTWGKKTTPSIRGREEEAIPQTKTNLQNQEIKDKESIWKQSTLYLAFASGIGICLLGLGIYWLLSKKAKSK